MADGALGDATPVDSGVRGSPGDGFVEDCVFCAASAHPDPLFETPRLLVIPDLYPLVPGHVLVITRRHESCLGAAGAETLGELPAVVRTAGDFLTEAYGRPPMLWENGVVGQTVPHAHLHMIPIDVDVLAQSLVDDEASEEVHGWDDVAARYAARGEYHYIKVGRRGWLVEANGAMNWEGRRRLAMAAGAGRATGKVLRTAREDDVADLARRWREWEKGGT
jgi:diadenosine tetraphosphate (Ap4A) HIT family hydrolase